MRPLSSIGSGILILLILVSSESFAQLFESKALAKEGLSESQISWADFNGNDSLEVLVTGVNTSGGSSAFVVRNTWRTNPQFQDVNIRPLTEGTTSISDVNNDGFPDILISGKDETGKALTLLYHNKKDFNFELATSSLAGFSDGNSIIADFNNDGKRDIFLNGVDGEGKAGTVLYKNLGTSFQIKETTIIALGHGSALTLDFNKDGLLDIIISGSDDLGKVRTLVYKNEGNFVFTLEQELKGFSSGKGAIGDFNHDGFTDIIFTGVTEDGSKASTLFYNRMGSFEESDFGLEGLSGGNAFISDMNHDGYADILISGLDANATYKMILYFGKSGNIASEEVITSLSNANFRIGDADRDGNPDVFEIGTSQANTMEMRFHRNTTLEPNLGPSPAINPIVLPLRGKAIFFWESAIDDVSPSRSLTYDIVVSAGEQLLKVPDAELSSGYRRTVGFGSQQQDTTWFMTGLKDGIYDWGILTQDNAFRGDGPGGICTGGAFRMCFEMASSDTTLCEKGPLAINSEGAPLHIYSVNKGYLGIHTQLEYEVSKSDTLYLISTNPLLCTSSLELIVNLLPDEEKLDLGEDLMVCKGGEVNLQLPEGYTASRWSLNGEDKGEGATFNFTVEENSEVIVEAYNLNGCVFMDTLNVLVNPELQITVSESASIYFGESMPLFTSGGQSYSWTPAEGLNDANIPNPIASPESTTTYHVVVTDEFGCEAAGSVKVTVLSNLFVPNLFSPNGDGKNESFKIYGGSHNDLVFQVFDRSGNLVYEGNNNEPFQNGWDGNKNGKPQPAGTYIWRLKGKNEDGSIITYQGKSSGTINLVR